MALPSPSRMPGEGWPVGEPRANTELCLHDELILAYLAGSVTAAEVDRIDRHLAACAACCTLVAETAKLVDDDGMHTSPAKVPDEVAVHREGLRVGRYEIIEVLGRGGMSVVHRAHDPELHRDVAIKLLHPEVTRRRGAAESKARVLREARAMARVAHPNVVAIYDVGEWNDEVFVAMELVEGTTLRAWIRERKPRWEAALDMLLSAGEGLGAAHDAGLVHRDFKPENVLVGRDGRPRVTDFGLARAVTVDTDEAEAMRPDIRQRLHSITATGVVSGTPAYMSPEQYLAKATDARTDEFSFCVALYEALYGHRPFAGESFELLAVDVLNGHVRPAPPETDVPEPIRAVVLRGLSVAPEARYPSLRALLAELTAARHVKPAPPAGRAEVPPVPRRRWKAVAAAGAGVLVLAFAAKLATSRRAETPPVTSEAVTTPTEAPEPLVTAEPPSAATAATAEATAAASVARPQAIRRRSKPNVTTKGHTTTGATAAPLGDKVENPF